MISILIFVSATDVNVVPTAYQQESGTVITLYFENSSLTSSTSPAPNTQTVQPSTNGSTYVYSFAFLVSPGYLWSPPFSSGLNLPSGVVVVNFWASAFLAGTIEVFLNVTNSSGTVLSSQNSSVSLNTTETEYTLFFPSPSSIPPGGYLSVAFSAPNDIDIIYWGSGQPTNFQLEEFIESS
ncbi:MAG: hypothetical protein QW292_05405 [Candidatus Parvarchaeota archaeon]